MQVRALSGGGSAELQATMTKFSAQSSVSINCNIGDIVAVEISRSAQTGIWWNNSLAHLSADLVDSNALGTSNYYVYFFKASQAANTFRIVEGTITGDYVVITNQE